MRRSEFTELYGAIGRLIAEKRRTHDPPLTQAQLADKTGGYLTRSAIANMERGRQRVAAHHLYVLADALELPPAAFLPADRVQLREPETDGILAGDLGFREFTERILKRDLNDLRTEEKDG